MASRVLAENYENTGVVRTNLLYDPSNGNSEIIEPGIGGKILFKDGTFTEDGKLIYSSDDQKRILEKVKNDLRAAQKKINGAKLQPWAQNQQNVDPNPNPNPSTNELTVGGFEQFTSENFAPNISFGDLKYPKDMNSKQDRIFITQIEYKRSELIQREGNLKTLKDIKGTVTLPMPNDISETNAVGWGEDSLSNIAALAMPGLVSAGLGAAEGDIAGAVQKAFDAARNTLTSGSVGTRARQFLATNAAAAVVKKFNVNVNPEAYITRSTGAAINPNLELLFNGPKLRQFGFQFKMTPRSQDEAKEIRTIIRFFKQGMSPKKGIGDASFFLGTPNIFKIRFKPGENDNELKSIGKIKTCALVSFAVNYTPDGFYAAYEDSLAGGSQPISITMQLGFTELTPIFNDEYGGETDDIGPNVQPNADSIEPEETTSQQSSRGAVQGPANDGTGRTIQEVRNQEQVNRIQQQAIRQVAGPIPGSAL